MTSQKRHILVVTSYLLTSLLIINYGFQQRDNSWLLIDGAVPLIVIALFMVRCALGWFVAETTGLFAKNPDERQIAQRNRVYAISYKALLVLLLLLAIGWLAWPPINKYPIAWFMPDINNAPWVGYADQMANFLISFFDFIVFLPIHIIVWLEPDPIEDTDAIELNAV